MAACRTPALPAALMLAAALCANPAMAQSARSGASELGTSPIVAKLEACTEIADDAARLACYDQEVAALVGASDQGDVRVIDAETIKQARRGLFGFRLPRIGLFGGDDAEEADGLFQSTVTRVRNVAPGEWHFWIEDGDAQWRIKNPAVGFRPPAIGDKVEFKPASMGTFWVRINGRTGVRGNRIG